MGNLENIRGEEPKGGQYQGASEGFTKTATTKVFGGGNVMSVDDSSATQVAPFNEQSASTDEIIVGISLNGSKNQELNQYETGREITMVRHGLVDVCLADDNAVLAFGDYLRAETDSITYDGEVTSDMGVVDKLEPTAYTTTGDAPTNEDFNTMWTEFSEIVGLCMEAKTSSSGGYVKCFLTIPPRFVPANA